MSRSQRDVIENRGSTARDHLANERTFLAWVRTALGIIGLGALLAKLVDTEGIWAQVAGTVLIGFGGATLIYSVFRYQHVASALRSERYIIARWGPLLIAIISLMVAVGALLLVLT